MLHSAELVRPFRVVNSHWANTTTPRVVASTPVGIDPLQLMSNARDLPSEHYVDYTLIFH